MEMTEMSTASEAKAHDKAEAAHDKAEAKAHEDAKYKHKVTMPALGSMVWYYYVNTKDADGNLAPHAAWVSSISDHDDTVNLSVLEHSGMAVNAAHVPVMAANAKTEDNLALEDYCIIPK
jgi:hypothetical protein